MDLQRLLALAAVVGALALAPRAAAAQEAAAGTPVGSFFYYPKKDPIDDHDVSILMVQASEEGLSPPQLIWQCAENNGYNLSVSDVPLTRGPYVPLLWRFDQQPAESVNWAVSTGSAFAGSDAETFTNRALVSHQVVIRVTSSQGEVVTSTFKLEHAKEAMDSMACLRLPPTAPSAPAAPVAP
jgi:hypothetical protein